MTYYFHAIRSVDVILAVSCARKFKSLNPGAKAVLLATKFPQFSYASLVPDGCFDMVVELPYCDYIADLPEGIRRARCHYAALSSVSYDQESVFFLFDDSELACLNILALARRLRAAGRRVGLYRLVYVVNPLSYGFGDKGRIQPLRSLLCSAYSIPLIGSALLCRGLPHTISFGRDLDFSLFDAEVFFNCNPPPGHKAACANVPAPFSVLSPSDYLQAPRLEPGAVIFLADRLAAYLPDLPLWAALNASIMRRLRAVYPGRCLYIKMHPTDPDKDYSALDLSGFTVLPKAVSLEMLLVANPGRVSAVYSFMSTGLFCSAGLGVPSAFLYPLLNSAPAREKYFDLILARNTLGINRVSRLEEIGATMPAPVPAGDYDWRGLISRLKPRGG